MRRFMPREMRRSQPWLGTFVEITARHRDSNIARRAIDAGFAAIARVHRAMSPQIADSDVDHINRAAVNEPVRVCEATWRVLVIADDLHRRSEGLFDCAIDSASNRINVSAIDGASNRDFVRLVESEGDRQALAQSQRDLDLSTELVVIKRRPLTIDLGGIAKGFAVDAALDAMRDAGAASACVNAGGDIATFGDESIRVDVRDPQVPSVHRRLVELRDFAVATSSIEVRNALATGPHARDVDRDAFDRGATICVLAPRCVFADALTKVVALSSAGTHPLLAHYSASAIVLTSRGDRRHV